MFAKHAFNPIRTVVRNARLAAPVKRSRAGLAAAWRRDPVSGHLELKWQPVGGGHDLADPPTTRGAARRQDERVNRRPLETAAATILARRAVA